MRYYEIVFMVNPDMSENVPNIIEKYRSVIRKKKGKIYRLEDWGNRQLAYSIGKLQKAHYILLNVKIEKLQVKKMLNELENIARFNNSIIRSIIIRIKNIITEESPMMKIKNEQLERLENNKNVKENNFLKNSKKINNN